jgi:hypothetical protein
VQLADTIVEARAWINAERKKQTNR